MYLRMDESIQSIYNIVIERMENWGFSKRDYEPYQNYWDDKVNKFTGDDGLKDGCLFWIKKNRNKSFKYTENRIEVWIVRSKSTVFLQSDIIGLKMIATKSIKKGIKLSRLSTLINRIGQKALERDFIRSED
jgi:hypothetical protein